jgi:putative Mg2+ transporter-C (MgtC) family protein
MSEIFSSIYFSVFLRLLMAVVLGGLIGLEREFHGRPAGLRTHILVCMGATIIMISPELLSSYFTDSVEPQSIRIDPGRIIAGIVTGIGFLGAGAIIRIGDFVRGLTTAACIWFTAALGIVIGGGHYFLAFVSTGMGLFVLLLFDKIGHFIVTTNYRRIIVSMSQENFEDVENVARDIFQRYAIRIQDRSHYWHKTDEEMVITFQIRTKNDIQSGSVVKALGELQGVKFVQWE